MCVIRKAMATSGYIARGVSSERAVEEETPNPHC